MRMQRNMGLQFPSKSKALRGARAEIVSNIIFKRFYGVPGVNTSEEWALYMKVLDVCYVTTSRMERKLVAQIFGIDTTVKRLPMRFPR